jgi:inner membrane protein
MASLGHIAVGVAAGRLQRPERPLAWMTGFSALSLGPDLDVVAFALGIPYEHAFGHRGASHALLVGLIGAFCALVPGERRDRIRAGLLGVLVLASHGVLDAMTTGGLGAALLWPFGDARYFAPWRPIPVAPIGAGMLSMRGLYVLAYEALLFSPLLAFGLWPRRSGATCASSTPGQRPSPVSDDE